MTARKHDERGQPRHSREGTTSRSTRLNEAQEGDDIPPRVAPKDHGLRVVPHRCPGVERVLVRHPMLDEPHLELVAVRMGLGVRGEVGLERGLYTSPDAVAAGRRVEGRDHRLAEALISRNLVEGGVDCVSSVVPGHYV